MSYHTSSGVYIDPAAVRYVQNADGTFRIEASASNFDALAALDSSIEAKQSVNQYIPEGSMLAASVEMIARRILDELFQDSNRAQPVAATVDAETGSYYGGGLYSEVSLRRHLSLDGGRIRNIGPPVYENDAVNRGFVEEFVTNALGVMREELKKEMLGDGLEALKLRVKTFSLLEDQK